eukprot:gene4346-5074_t
MVPNNKVESTNEVVVDQQQQPNAPASLPDNAAIMNFNNNNASQPPHMMHPQPQMHPGYPPPPHMVMPMSPQNFYIPSQYTSLYVGDLSSDVNELVLGELFTKVGRSAVASIHVCRDSLSFRSLGYAYVNFYNTVDAERALDTLNYSLVLGRPCRIMWSSRDPTKRRSNVGNIFVKNLEKSVDSGLLYDTFSLYGNILSCKIEMEKGVSKGYGYVHFETHDSSERAIEKVNGTMLLGKQICVEPFVSKVERFKEKNEHKLFFKNIDETTTSTMIEEELSKFGEIQSCIIRTDPAGKSKGLGFVEFKNVEDAQKLLDHTEPVTIAGKQVTLDRIKNKMERVMESRRVAPVAMKDHHNGHVHAGHHVPHLIHSGHHAPHHGATTTTSPNTNTNSTHPSSLNLTLFIHNIDESVDKDLIKDEFAKYGNILGIKIVQENGKNRGFGFLSYATQEEANKAIENMNGFMCGTKALAVSFSNRKFKKRMTTQLPLHQSPDQMPYVYYRSPYPNQVYPQPYYANPHQISQMPPQPIRGGYPPKPLGGYKGRGGSVSSMNGRQPGTYPRKPRTMNPHYKRSEEFNNNDSQPTTTTTATTTTTSTEATTTPVDTTATTATEQTTTTAIEQPVTTTTATTLTLEHLLSLAPEEQQDAIGSEIYVLVMAEYPDHAPKITGMILSSLGDITELYNLVASGSVNEKIKQAYAMLVEQQQQQQATNGNVVSVESN